MLIQSGLCGATRHRVAASGHLWTVSDDAQVRTAARRQRGASLPGRGCFIRKFIPHAVPFSRAPVCSDFRANNHQQPTLPLKPSGVYHLPMSSLLHHQPTTDARLRSQTSSSWAVCPGDQQSSHSSVSRLNPRPIPAESPPQHPPRRRSRHAPQIPVSSLYTSPLGLAQIPHFYTFFCTLQTPP